MSLSKIKKQFIFLKEYINSTVVTSLLENIQVAVESIKLQRLNVVFNNAVVCVARIELLTLISKLLFIFLFL